MDIHWIIRIENEKDKRILVNFDPKETTLSFYGEIRKNGNWIKFSENSLLVKEENSSDLEGLKDIIYKTYQDMVEKFETFKMFDDVFRIIKEIKIDE